jgi:hypothetical protein
MVAHAGADGAPRVTRAQAARALGADPARLEDVLAGRARDAGEAQDARDAQDARTGSGLREDQAAAALAVLADGRLVSVLNAPAGAGKTRVLSEAARIWAQGGWARWSASPRPSRPATPWPPECPCRTTPRSSWATCPAGAAPAAPSPSARAPCW